MTPRLSYILDMYISVLLLKLYKHVINSIKIRHLLESYTNDFFAEPGYFKSSEQKKKKSFVGIKLFNGQDALQVICFSDCLHLFHTESLWSILKRR